MSKSLQGKIAIITGGSRGIGAAIAVEFANRGATGITITYVSNADAAESALSKISSFGTKALAIKSPVSDVASADSVIEQTLSAFKCKGIDILINNAGDTTLYLMGSITASSFMSTYTTNVLAPLLLIQSVLPVINRGGRIVNISSRAARVPLGGAATIYASSKAALEHLTRNLAVTHAADKGITINNVMPGGTATDGMNSAPRAMIEKVIGDATAEHRLGTPEEVASVVAFMVEDGGSRWINGDTINVSGGAAMW